MNQEPSQERVSVDLMSPKFLRARAIMVAIVAVVLGAAIGGLVGLFAGRIGGLIAAAVIALPLLLLALLDTRHADWLADGVVSARRLTTRTVDLRKLTRIELLISYVRGKRMVMLVIGGAAKASRATLLIATYTINAGAELDIVALRRLADALAGGETAHGLVFSELLVAQLRAIARDAPMGDRPLYRIASLAASGKLTQRMPPDAITQFVATLD